MSIYHGKLLELLSIEKQADQFFLRVRISFTEENVELLWKLDDATGENLKARTESGNEYKYRLSFQSSWDAKKKQYMSFLTKTYRDQSEKVYFPCSQEYINGLDSIKQIELINKIHTLPFLTTKLPDDKIEPIQEKQEIVSPKHINRKKSTWLALAAIGAIFTFLVSFSGYSIKIEIAEKTPVVNAESVEQETEPVEIETDVVEFEAPSFSERERTKLASKPASIPSLPVYKLESDISYSIPDGAVALTFDDGPSIYSKEIVDILSNYQAGGTFFYVGLNVKKYPNNVQYVKNKGYSIGSHSMNHTNLTNFSIEQQEKDLLQTNQLIEEITHEEVSLFRPPFGAMDERLLNLMQKHDQRMILWNKDPEDWKSKDADEIFNYVVSTGASGSIIILHESQAVIDALPRIIEYLQEQELEIVSLVE